MRPNELWPSIRSITTFQTLPSSSGKYRHAGSTRAAARGNNGIGAFMMAPQKKKQPRSPRAPAAPGKENTREQIYHLNSSLSLFDPGEAQISQRASKTKPKDRILSLVQLATQRAESEHNIFQICAQARPKTSWVSSRTIETGYNSPT